MPAIHTTPRRSPWPWIVGAAALMGVMMLSACSTPRTPEGVQPVSGFDVGRYTGQWHEVARIENSFERGLTQATATYSRNADNTIKVVNRGYDPVRGALVGVGAGGPCRVGGQPRPRSAQGVFLRAVLRRLQRGGAG